MVDYWNIEVPEDKDRSEFTYAERRAEVLKLAFEKGHPNLLEKQKLAGEYGVAPSSISNDLDILAEYISKNLGEKSDLLAELVYGRGIRETVAEGDWAEARRLMESWQEWLMARGAVEKEPEKHEIDKSERIQVNIVPTGEGEDEDSPRDS